MTSGSHHEQQYSLDLDGSGDYLQIISNNGFGMSDNNAFTISLWFKTSTNTGGAQAGNILIGVNTSANANVLRLGVDTGGGIYLNTDTDAAASSDTYGTTDYEDDTWHHLVITRASGGSQNHTIYIDGSSISTSAESDDVDWTGAYYFNIGMELDGGGASDFFTGLIDEVAIWNTALIGSAVTDIRNSGKPFDLNYDRGNYNNSSALVGYWRMGNGLFDDKQNGVVHDAHNPGFGADLVVNGGFDADSDWSESGTTSWSISSGKASSDGSVAGNNYLINSPTTAVVGKTYKVEFTVSNYVQGAVKVRAGQAAGVNVTANGSYTQYQVATATETCRLHASSNFIGKVDNVSVKPLNGYPGLTAADATFSADTPDD